jgi:LysM repeat protein
MEQKQKDRPMEINPRPYEEFREEAGYPASKKKRRRKLGLRRWGLSGLPWGWVVAAFCFLGLLAVVFTPGLTRQNDDRRVLALETRIGQLESRIASLEENTGRAQNTGVASGPPGERIGAGAADRTGGMGDAPKAAASVSTAVEDRAEKSGADPYHEIKAGETLYSISRRYNVSVEALRRINGLAPEAFLHPGQKLKIPPP